MRVAANANGKPIQRLVVNAMGQLDQSLLRITEGFLYKKGGANHGNGIRRNWKRRYFVLGEYDTEFGVGYELRYYDNPNGSLKGTIDLNGCEVFCEARSMHKQVKYEFQILLASGNIQQLSSDNYEGREDWIESLNMAIAYMKKMWGGAGGPLGFNLDGYDPHLEDDEDIHEIGAQLAQQVHVFGDGMYGAEAGGYGQFVIQLFDLNGEKVVRGGAPLTVSISNEECLYYLKIHDNGDGSYFVHYMLYKPGAYRLRVKLNDEHEVKGSPFELTVMPSKTVPEKCVAYGDCLSTMSPNCTYTFTIQARDIFANDKTRGGDPFELGVMGAAQLRSIDDNGDGTCKLCRGLVWVLLV
jgi:hypothetical protein